MTKSPALTALLLVSRPSMEPSRQQRARQTVSIIFFAARDPQSMTASPIFNVCIEKQPLWVSQRLYCLLTREFFNYLMQEVSSVPSERNKSDVILPNIDEKAKIKSVCLGVT